MKALIILTAFLLVNMLILDYVLFLGKNVAGFKAITSERSKSNDENFNVVNVASPSSETVEKPKIVDSCSPFSCVELIQQATASLTLKKTTATAKTTPSSTNGAKEYYVTLGSEQTLSDEWEDIAGTSVYIDSTKYGKIKTVTFEPSIRIPTANGVMYARLFNDTDKHPVWFSEVSMEGNTSKLVLSSPITLDPGNKLYKVQMKTTLKYLTILDSARVHIITE